MKAKNRKAKAAINEAIEWAGGLTQLAAEMRVSDQTIREWLKLGRVPPTPARLMALLVSEIDIAHASWLGHIDLEARLRA